MKKKLSENIILSIFLIASFVQILITGFNHFIGYNNVTDLLFLFLKFVIGTAYSYVFGFMIIIMAIKLFKLQGNLIPSISSKLIFTLLIGAIVGSVLTIILVTFSPYNHPRISKTPLGFTSKITVAKKHFPSIIFVSDTQQPIWFETFFLDENDNQKATSLIYHEIELDTSAIAIFHIGDITAVGMFDSYWNTFDEFKRKLKAPFYPVIGNHDYFYFKTPALKQFQKRFPAMTQTWYSVVIQAVGIIALNSNFSKLSDEDCKLQKQWYQKQLYRFDSDSTISSVIVLSHHAPYTNSKIAEPSYEVQKQFLPAFLLSSKASVFISGQSHAYEHFKMDGKNFFVIGGGGGLLHPLMTGSEQRYHDEFDKEFSKGFFHYLECSIERDSLVFYVNKLKNDFSGFTMVDSISVSYEH